MRQMSSKFELADAATASKKVLPEQILSLTWLTFDLGVKTVPEQSVPTWTAPYPAIIREPS